MHAACLTVGSPVPRCVCGRSTLNFRLSPLVSGDTQSFFSFSFELLLKAISAQVFSPAEVTGAVGPLWMPLFLLHSGEAENLRSWRRRVFLVVPAGYVVPGGAGRILSL